MKTNRATNPTCFDVALNFIQSMHDPLAEFAPHFTAIPKRMGGSLMRVYRDTRFSKNKTPYKTNIGIQFRHRAGQGRAFARLLCAY